MSKVAKKHKEARALERRERREEKRRARRAGIRPREVDTRALRERLLIVCEGARTEPHYFRCFRVNARVAVTIEGVGQNTDSLVVEAMRIRDQDGGFTEVWVVMDRDSFPAGTFNAALQRARNEGISVAYSNEAFELWYLLHFEYCDAALSRSTFGERLTRYLGHPYRKNDAAMYATLLDKQPVAIQNAERLLAAYGDDRNPERDNPSTTVHGLVERLNALSR